ncbi:MAG: AzlC family ABC transporter permease [Bacilli bacterium]|nr:AzlC family ABC transporter permease [Bacilli bacterium]
MKDFQLAFKRSIPVLVEYIILGIGFGVIMASGGYHFLYSTFASILIFAGAGEYVLANLVTTSASFITIFFMSILINIRYAFYGLSFIQHTANWKWYEKVLFFMALPDETYSILVANSLGSRVDTKRHDLWLAGLNYAYWVIGSTLGALLGSFPIDFTGVDFIMTALFVIILVDQIRKKDNPRLAIIIGALSAIISYLIFKDNFIFPAIASSIILIFLFRKKIEAGLSKEAKDE